MTQHYFTLFLLFITIALKAQTAKIFVHSNFSGFPDVTEINSVYTNVGFSTVNITSASVDATLTISNYDIAYIVEYYNYSAASPVFLTNVQRQIVQQFIEDGGHVVWVAESIDNYISSSTTPPVNSNAITTINNIYGTGVTYGTFFNNGGMGSPNMPRIHPSVGAGGLSQQSRILGSGSYATLLNVPTANKLYTSDVFDNTNTFDACTHTTLALFPAQPITTAGTIIISSELGVPFHATSVGPFGGAPFVHNTVLDSTIAVLHLNLETNVNMSLINSWGNTSSNTNVNCPLPILLATDFLLKFDAKVTKHRTVLLDWILEKEHGMDAYTVERSIDGVDWVPLVHEALTVSNEYRAIDLDPFIGISYYRLKLMNNQNEVYYSRIEIVEIEALNRSNVVIYPNPTTNIFTIENLNSSIDIDQKWTLLDQLGQELPLVILRKNKNKIVVDISHLSTGIYLLRTSFGTKKIHKY